MGVARAAISIGGRWVALSDGDGTIGLVLAFMGREL